MGLLLSVLNGQRGKMFSSGTPQSPPRVPQRAKSVPATEAGESCPGLLKRGTGEPGHTKGAASARAAPASGMRNI